MKVLGRLRRGIEVRRGFEAFKEALKRSKSSKRYRRGSRGIRDFEKGFEGFEGVSHDTVAVPLRVLKYPKIGRAHV